MQSRTKESLQIALLVVLLTLMVSIPLLANRFALLATDLLAPGTGPDIANSDFVNYWMGGVLALEGDAALLFNPPAYYKLLQSMFGPDYPPHAWSYPPHALLLFWPLGLMPFEVAMVVFLGGTLALFLVAANDYRRKIAPQASATVVFSALWPFIAMNLAATQNGFLTGALILGFLIFRTERPWLAGLCLALLTIKPQLGLLIPFMLVFARQWRTFMWAAIFTLLLVALSALLFGADKWIAFVRIIMPFQQLVMLKLEGSMLIMMPTILSGLRLLGVDPELARSWQIFFSLACLPPVLYALWRLRGPGNEEAAALVLTGGTFLVAPYSFNYDMGALSAVAAIIFARSVASHEGQPARGTRISLLACLFLCLLPVSIMVMGWARVPLAAPAIAACLLLYRPAGAAAPSGGARFPRSWA